MTDEISGDESSATGFVYLARCRGFHKIGWTERSPADRVRQLQTGCPFPIEMVGTVPATPADDWRWQRLFAPQNVRGEWFRLTPEDVRCVLSGDFAGVLIQAGKWANHREATLEGMRRAAEQGRKGGAKPKLAAEQIRELHDMREAGRTTYDIMHAFGISRATLYRYLGPQATPSSQESGKLSLANSPNSSRAAAS